MDIGGLLDAWHKTMGREPVTIPSVAVDKQTYALIPGLNKYKKDPTVAKTLALRQTVEAQLKAIDAHIQRAGAARRRSGCRSRQACRQDENRTRQVQDRGLT